MIESFKKGGKMPKRIVWEIVLGVLAVVEKESSLVEVTVPEGVSCDIVGDSESSRLYHGSVLTCSPRREQNVPQFLLIAAILRCAQPAYHYQAPIGQPHDCLQRCAVNVIDADVR